jgi:hypothetical protein
MSAAYNRETCDAVVFVTAPNTAIPAGIYPDLDLVGTGPLLTVI